MTYTQKKNRLILKLCENAEVVLKENIAIAMGYKKALRFEFFVCDEEELERRKKEIANTNKSILKYRNELKLLKKIKDEVALNEV